MLNLTLNDYFFGDMRGGGEISYDAINFTFLLNSDFKFVLHSQIMFNVKAKTSFVSLSNHDYMIAEGYLD